MGTVKILQKSDLRIDWDKQEPKEALTLPSRYFYDEDIFEAEKKNIFMGAWHVIGHKNELNKAGQYIVCDLFDQSIIATCDNEGKVHAFHNVCQHRGNRLVEERRGIAKGLFRCSYHSWCYGLDGSLRGAPRSDRLQNFNKERFSIPLVRVEELGGFLYFNLDPNAPSMADLFPGADADIRRAFPKISEMQLVEQDDVIVPANWKVIMDNSIEAYHFTRCGSHHRDLAALIKFDEYELKQYGNWWTYIAPAKLDLQEAYDVKIEQPVNPNESFYNIGLWPHNTFYTFPFSGCIASFLIIPLEAEKTLLRFGYYYPGSDLPEITKASMHWMNHALGPEDIALNASVQRGLHSLGYDQGRYIIDAQRSNESEHLVHHFHTLVYNAIHGRAHV